MKALLTILAATFLAAPCPEPGSTQFAFAEFQPGVYHRLHSDFGAAVLTLEAVDDDCIEIIDVDLAIHHEDLGPQGIVIGDGGLRFTFDPPVWGVMALFSSDWFDAERLPTLNCHIAGTFDFLSDRTISQDSVGPGTYETLNVSVLPGPRPTPLDYCVLNPHGSGVFMGLLSYTPDPPVHAAMKGQPTRRGQ